MARKRSGSGKFFGITQQTKDAATGAAVAVFLEPTVDQVVQQFAGNFNLQIQGIQTDDVAKILIGQYLQRKQSGAIAKFGEYISILAAGRIVKGFLSGSNLLNLGGNANANATAPQALTRIQSMDPYLRTFR